MASSYLAATCSWHRNSQERCSSHGISSRPCTANNVASILPDRSYGNEHFTIQYIRSTATTLGLGDRRFVLHWPPILPMSSTIVETALGRLRRFWQALAFNSRTCPIRTSKRSERGQSPDIQKPAIVGSVGQDLPRRRRGPRAHVTGSRRAWHLLYTASLLLLRPSMKGPHRTYRSPIERAFLWLHVTSFCVLPIAHKPQATIFSKRLWWQRHGREGGLSIET